LVAALADEVWFARIITGGQMERLDEVLLGLIFKVVALNFFFSFPTNARTAALPAI